MADRLSQLQSYDVGANDVNIIDVFPNKTLMAISIKSSQWYEDFANYLVYLIILESFNHHQQRKFLFDVK